MIIFLCAILMACGSESEQQVIIPQAQLAPLDKAKKLQNDLVKMHQQKQKEMQEQGYKPNLA